MLRSSFFSIGLFVTLWGVSLLFIDKLVLKAEQQPEQAQVTGRIRAMLSSAQPAQEKIVDPPDWAAFSLMSIGSVTMLYAVALPKKE